VPGANYLAAYQNKRLHDIVIPGAHDSGVYTANADNVQTQALDIAGQADAGCRFFDCRIAAHRIKIDGHNRYVHTAYHLNDNLVNEHKVRSNSKNVGTWQSMRDLGGWGGTLTSMLHQASNFVTNNGREFIILKFSKCFNWAEVAEVVEQTLGPKRYLGGGNLNNKRVSQLAGTVVTVYDEAARSELDPYIARLNAAGTPHGILYSRALFDKKTKASKDYLRGFSGLQYFGKFSSTDDVDANTAKQGKVMVKGAATNVEVLGMMYWTTTGVFGNIRARNDQMWTQTNIRALQQTWKSGLEAAITERFGNDLDIAKRMIKQGNAMNGHRLKAFMPNIVMMDFVDRAKCDIVDGLNTVASHELNKLILK
jgi:hypothetical protein